MEREYASKGIAGAGLGLGIAGTVGTVAELLGGWGRSTGSCSENTPVNRYEMTLTQEVEAKNAEIALLKANAYFDQKLVDVYSVLDKRDRETRDLIAQNKEEQYAINMNQAVLNGTTGTAISCLQAQVAALQGMTKTVIPADNVCPPPMPLYNSWTAPTTTTTATT